MCLCERIKGNNVSFCTIWMYNPFKYLTQFSRLPCVCDMKTSYPPFYRSMTKSYSISTEVTELLTPWCLSSKSTGFEKEFLKPSRLVKQELGTICLTSHRVNFTFCSVVMSSPGYYSIYQDMLHRFVAEAGPPLN